MSPLVCCLLGLLTGAHDGPAAQPRPVSVEVTILSLSGPLEVTESEQIDAGKLQQLIGNAQKSGVFRHLTRVRLATLDGEKAEVQLGQSQLMATGWSQAGPRRAMAYQDEQTGTMISVTPKIMDHGHIILRLDIEQTRLTAAVGAADQNKDPVRPPKASLGISTTAKVPSGQTILLAGAQQADTKEDQLRTYVVVSASVSD